MRYYWENRRDLDCSLNKLYAAMKVTKQSVHKRLKRHYNKMDITGQLISMIYKIRLDHPTMGMREMYFKLSPSKIGRDAFERLCRKNGFKLKTRKNAYRTTDSQGVKRFPNLLEGLDIIEFNQIWQSDITYFEIGRRFYYITLIQDSYTKMIVGYNTSKRLTTECTTLPSLRMAIKREKGRDLSGLIFHSDGGGQYYANKFIALTSKENIINSMGKTCYENAMAESLNGVIKNKYLHHRTINSFKELQQEVDRTVVLYNEEKPHSALNRLTPIKFKEKVITCTHQTNATMTKSLDAESRMNKASSLIRPNQTNAQNQNVLSTEIVI